MRVRALTITCLLIACLSTSVVHGFSRDYYERKGFNMRN
jgi:hypothetical protein